MKIKDLFKSRTVSFNAIVGAVIPLFNSLFPQYAIGAEVINQILVLGNLALRFMTDSSIGEQKIIERMTDHAENTRS